MGLRDERSLWGYMHRAGNNSPVVVCVWPVGILLQDMGMIVCDVVILEWGIRLVS